MQFRPAPYPKPPVFDPEPLRQQSAVDTLKAGLLLHPATMFALRRFCPTPRVNGIRIISRYDDCREALRHPDVFGVPWAAKMQMLAPSREPFVLATDVPAQHACGERRIMQIFRYDDGPRIAEIAGTEARRIVERASPTLDVVQDLILPVAREVYGRHYGIETPVDLMLWLMATSNYIFRQIGSDEVAKPIARAAIDHVTELIRRATRLAKERAQSRIKRDTIADRLIELQGRSRGKFPDDALHSTFIGMVSGYAPVGVAAAAHIIEVLLDRPKALEETRSAARDNDDRLTRCLLEALRFKPINPGLWRICRRDYTLAVGTPRAIRIREGEKILVFLQSAMQDETRLRHPWRFDPERPPSDSMVFGYGMHWCTGAPLAVAQLVPMLKPLLLRGFRRTPGAAGKTRLFGALPEHIGLTLGEG